MIIFYNYKTHKLIHCNHFTTLLSICALQHWTRYPDYLSITRYLSIWCDYLSITVCVCNPYPISEYINVMTLAREYFDMYKSVLQKFVNFLGQYSKILEPNISVTAEPIGFYSSVALEYFVGERGGGDWKYKNLHHPQKIKNIY